MDGLRFDVNVLQCLCCSGPISMNDKLFALYSLFGCDVIFI